ncbi:DUF4198 domain-containing protein [Planctobacterium marinum]|uniref:DUF4198 domain-containing protein n=1 Tax=Planctobacterium marinum TaxID=1631968 RepID=UPI001E346B4A|nr:DUF4198 domain-containing protein [Planctobacterium marinum]MCC2603956.1 DUF4198 domain-containing protein [Planctobacterium marinum]
MRSFIALTLLLNAGFASSVNAHTPYLKPFSFELQNAKAVTLDASFAEQFFVPESAISNADFDIVGPDGVTQKIETVVNLETRNVLEHKIEEDGTYKISTGNRLGPIFRIYELNGERGSLRGDEKPLPEGATLTAKFRPATSAITYVSKNAPTRQALKATQQGFEVLFSTHPNSLFHNEPVAFSVHMNGQPVAEQAVTIYHAKDQFSEESDQVSVLTDSTGNTQFTPTAAGLYLLKTRLRADAPAGADVAQYSYTTTVTFEVY